MVILVLYLEKRAPTDDIQQFITNFRKGDNLIPLDGIHLLWRNVAIGTERCEPVPAVKEEPIQHFQVLHERIVNVNNPTDSILNVHAKKEEQVLTLVSHQHDPQKGSELINVQVK